MTQEQQFLALSYQRTLVYLGLEDISAVFMLPEIAGGQGLNKDGLWVAAVARFLRVNINCGLIEISSGKEIIEGNGTLDFLEAIYLNTSPEERPEIWMGVQFSATKKLNTLLEENNLRRWEGMSADLNQNFTDAVFESYRKY